MIAANRRLEGSVKERGSTRRPDISVIIPTLNEERALADTFGNLLGQAGDFEIILVDGGSSDGTRIVAGRWSEIFRKSGRRFVVRLSEPGRSVQMNLGARAAEGRVLLFLHADTRLPAGALERVRELLEDERIVGGGFAHRFQEKGFRLRLVSLYATWRAARRRFYLGDQAPFVRRRSFESLGGFRPMPLFEDLDFARRLRRSGRIGFIPLPVRTSGRRFLQEGFLRSLLLIGLGKIFFVFGQVPDFLCRQYREIR